MKKTKTEKGITLIALILTIVILLILAIVAINSITNDDLLGKAEEVTGTYNNSVINEQGTISGYEGFLDRYMIAKIVDKDGNDITNKIMPSNTKVTDKYGNTIVVPAGFKIVVNDDTNNADTVTKGIVIEDCTESETKGSQFVWIPVGEIYTSENKATSTIITLGRYVFDSNGNIDTNLSKTNPNDELKTNSTLTYSYTEGLKDSTTSNAHARDIKAFIESAKTNGGYYIGRYEARTNNTTGRTSGSDSLTVVTSIKTNTVYNYVSQKNASDLSKDMYGDGYSSGTFSSDLINSYAWDTAIVFLQEFDNRVAKTTPYSRQNSLNTSLSLTGTTKDVICNVYDMASNCFEWSTEVCNDDSKPNVDRGGGVRRKTDGATSYAGIRDAGDTDGDGWYSNVGFRPILYMAYIV